MGSSKIKLLSSIKIEKLGHGGVGIATAPDGRTIIVKGGVLPGSLVDIKIVKSRKDYIEGHVHELHQLDPVIASGNVLCPHYLHHHGGQILGDHQSGCGGCKWQIINYPKQLEMKHSIVSECMMVVQSHIDAIGGVRYPLTTEEIFGYRNKIEYSFGKYITGKKSDSGEVSSLRQEHHWQLGFHRQGQFSKIIDIDQCYLTDEKMRLLFTHCKKILQESGLPVYDQMRHEGVFRHLMIRHGKHTNELMVVLSISDAYCTLRDIAQIRHLLMEDVYVRDVVTTCILVINNGLADIIYDRSSQSEILWGTGVIHEQLHFDDRVLTFEIAPTAFFQTNTHGAELLFRTARDMIGDVHGLLLDLYCGAGTIGLSLVAQGIGSKLIGIELVEAAIENAWINARNNGLEGVCEFYAGKAEDIIKKQQFDLTELECIVVDPPREGLHQDVSEFLISLKKQNPRIRLCYISCNPATLARDLALLTVHDGYELVAVQPVDMFPHTHHIENIAQLH